MMFNEVELQVKVHGRNKKHYLEILKTESLECGEIISVKQCEIPSTSRIEVLCNCEMCDTDFYRLRKDVREQTFCGNHCRNEFLKSVSPTANKDKIKVNCNVCNAFIEVVESKFNNQENFLCSRDCYKLHRSKEYSGDNLYNFQNKFVECSNDDCREKIKTSDYYINSKSHQFCSQDCYWKHRSNHYSEFYYVPQLFEHRKETLPESLVRQWLENNDIHYIQEYRCGKYFIDFYIPKENRMIEVYGDYWHVNPKIYGYEEGLRPLHPNQIGKWEQDENRISDIKNKGYIVNTIWENDIYNNLDIILSEIFNQNT